MHSPLLCFGKFDLHVFIIFFFWFSGWFKAVQAMTIIGLIGLFVATVLGFMYMFFHIVSKNTLLILMAVMLFGSGSNIIFFYYCFPNLGMIYFTMPISLAMIHLRVFQVQMAYFDEIGKPQCVLLIAQTVIILPSFRVSDNIHYIKKYYSLLYYWDLYHKKCKNQRELAFALETFSLTVIIFPIGIDSYENYNVL